MIAPNAGLESEVASLREQLEAVGGEARRVLERLGELEAEHDALRGRIRSHKQEHGTAPRLAPFEKLSGIPVVIARFGRLRSVRSK